MLSEKQLAANQANAQKSTGPRTEAGKKRSALNATRHGLSGQVVVLPQEDLAAYKAFSQGIVDSFAPKDPREAQLAQLYAGFQWRLNRAAAVEDTLFTVGIMEEVAENLNLEHPETHNATSNAKTFREESQVFDRLSIYTQRLVNGAAKVLKELKELQAERKQREADEMDEATLLYRFHKMQKAVFEPQKNGFALTVGQIRDNLRRDHLYAQAKIARDLNWDLPKFMQRDVKAA